MSRLTLIDPLTLIGRELLNLLPESTVGMEVGCVHTSAEDEHQIGEMGGEPVLIPPIKDPDELADSSILVVCGPEPGERFANVQKFLQKSPDAALLDIARLDSLSDLTTPVTTAPNVEDWPPRVRLAHPALCMADIVMGPLAHLRPNRLSITAFDPASSFGEHALQGMVRQAAARIQGEHVKDKVGGEVLAFNIIVRDSSTLLEEASLLFPGIVTTATLALSGCFHGHLSCLDIGFDHAVDEVMLGEVWSTEPDIQIGEFPARLDSVAGSDLVTLTPPMISSCGTGVSVTAMIDGLRIGGALSAVRALEAIAVEVR